MVNLKRYNIQVPNLLTNPWGYTPAKNGEWVKFNDIKELLNISTNNAMVPCKNHYAGRQCDFAVEWVCGSCPCQIAAQHQ